MINRFARFPCKNRIIVNDIVNKLAEDFFIFLFATLQSSYSILTS
jgi:hypothetical protein